METPFILRKGVTGDSEWRSSYACVSNAIIVRILVGASAISVSVHFKKMLHKINI